MSKPMTPKEFLTLLKYIQDFNSPVRPIDPKRKKIKYMYPSIDFRTNTVFAVEFRGFGIDHLVFHCQNECCDLPDSLFTRVKAWLDET